MPRTCSICGNSARAAIEAALAGGESFRNVAARHNLSASALRRHKAACGAPEIERAAERIAVNLADELLDHLLASLKELGEIAIEARAKEKFSAAVSAIREKTNTVIETWELLHPPERKQSESFATALVVLPPEAPPAPPSPEGPSPASGGSIETPTGSKDSADR